jgi:HAMP domain-containing protein
MIVICEECGKKYDIDPSRIKGPEAKAKCKACGHIISITRKETKPAAPSPPLRAKEPALSDREPEEVVPEPEEEEAPQKGKSKAKRAKVAGARKKGFGLRPKIFVLFFFVPIALMVSAGFFYLWALDDLSSLMKKESTRVVTNLGEQIIAEKARSVAEQARIYLSTRPNLKRQDFPADQEFQKVAVQKVGLTGYTALYAVPDEQGVWRTWAHTNPKILAIDMSTLKGPMGNNFDGFWKVFSGVKDGKESRGYYTWQEKDGSFRDKYMVCTPVKGTPYIVAATTYLDEFTKPVKDMEGRANQMSSDTRTTVFAIVGATLLLVGIIVVLYGQRLASRIKSLTNVAEKISVGDMDAEVTVKSKDEIGDLAEAINRMQASIRLSIERLRRRR